MQPDPNIDDELDGLAAWIAENEARENARDINAPRTIAPDDLAEIDRLLDALLPQTADSSGNADDIPLAVGNDSLGNREASLEGVVEARKSHNTKALSSSPQPANSDDTSLVNPHPLSPSITTPSPQPESTPTDQSDRQAALAQVRIAKATYAPSKRKPAPEPRIKFDRLPARDRIAEFHRALVGSGPTHAITLNLSPEIERKARAEALHGRSPLVWLHKRVRRELALAGLPTLFWIMQEEADVDSDEAREVRRAMGLPANKRLHLHGEMRLAKKDAKKARAALRKAGGPFDENRQFQAFTRADPDAGWLLYLAKDTYKSFPWVQELAQGRGIAGSQIVGKSYSVTDELRDLAQANYDERLRIPSGLVATR